MMDGFLFDLPPVPAKKRNVWDEFREFREVAFREMLITKAQAARLLGCSRQNVFDLVSRGRLREFHYLDGVYVSGREVAAYDKLNRESTGPRPGGPGKSLGLILETFDRS